MSQPVHPYLFGAKLPGLRAAGFQTCCIAGFQAGSTALPPAGLETCDTADLEVCDTPNRCVHRTFRRRMAALFLLALAFQMAAPAAPLPDLKLEAKLLWGANDRPDAVKYHLTDPALAATLRRNFKWTNYFEVTNLAAVIPLNQSRLVRLSDRCTLSIKYLGSSLVAVDCLNQGIQISKGTNTLPCIYAGTNLDDTAWFIRLRSLDDKSKK
jgi:hypothetical protein